MSTQRVDSNQVMPIMNNIVTPKVYDDVVGISLKSENIRRITSTGAGTQLYWELNSLSCNSFLDRKIALEFDATVQVPALAAGGPAFAVGDILAPAAGIVLRYSPVLSTASSVEISINNQKISYPINYYYEPLSRFDSGDAKNALRLAECPQFHDYGRYAAQPAGLNGIVGYDNFTHNGLYNPRGDILPVSVVVGAGGGDTRAVRYNWTEYIYLPPFTTFENQGGFYDIDSISISISLPAANTSLISINEVFGALLAGGAAAVGVDALDQGTQAMRLYTCTSTFDCPKNFAQLLPAYNLSRITSGPYNNVAAGAIENALTSNISLSKIPSRFLIFASRVGLATVTQANTYASITSLSMTFNDRSDYFRYYRPYDIWKRLIFDKGNKVPYHYYRNFTGSPIMVEAHDIYGCPPAGTPCCSNFQVQLSFQNLYGAQANFQVTVVPIFDSMITYTRNTFSINDIIVDDKSIMDKAYEEYNSVPQTIPKSLCKIGGSFKEDVINGISTIVGGIDAAKRFYKSNQNWIDPLLSTAKDLGLSALEVLPMLFAAGLHPDAAFQKLSMVYPEKDLAPLLRHLNEAGCCCQMPANWPIDGGKMKASRKKKKGGVMIQTEEEFEAPKSKMSLRDRF